MGEHWKLYLPAVLVAFVFMVPAIVLGERRGMVKQVFVAAVALLLLTEILFALGTHSFSMLVGALVCFFVAFNILEATLPSLISRMAPLHSRGAALGVYNSTQALGLFLGGALGGWLANTRGPASVFMAAAVMVALWFAVALRMPNVLPRAPVDAHPVLNESLA